MNEKRRIVVASDLGLPIRASSDISDLLSASIGSAGLVLTEDDLGQQFFDLHSGLAGELFQKTTNYRLRVAIVLPDPGRYGERFGELAYEHKSHNTVRFVGSKGEALAWLES